MMSRRLLRRRWLLAIGIVVVLGAAIVGRLLSLLPVQNVAYAKLLLVRATPEAQKPQIGKQSFVREQLAHIKSKFSAEG